MEYVHYIVILVIIGLFTLVSPHLFYRNQEKVKKDNITTRQRKTYLKRKNLWKAISITLRWMLLFYIIACGVAILIKFLKQKNTPPPQYQKEQIHVWEDESYGRSVDPGEFPKKFSQESLEDKSSDDPIGEGEAGNTDESETEEIAKVIEGNTDYSMLEFFGPYFFGDYITQSDLKNMEEKYEEYLSSKAYLYIKLRIKKDLDNETEESSDLFTKITDFDTIKRDNPDLLTEKDYIRNAEDRWYYYMETGITDMLEQSAISAESAVEEAVISESGSYTSFFSYIQAAVVRFDMVLGFNGDSYVSGTASDVKYRIGKVMYKPVVNLKNLTRQENYYSLCSSYVVLKDAYKNSTPESKYNVEIAYYYFRASAEIALLMESEEAQSVCEEAIGAYREFCNRGDASPDNKTYRDYGEEAEKLYDNVSDRYVLIKGPENIENK